MNIQTLTSPEPYHLKTTATAAPSTYRKTTSHHEHTRNHLSNDTALGPLLSPIHQPITAKAQQLPAISTTTSMSTATAYGSPSNQPHYTTNSHHSSSSNTAPTTTTTTTNSSAMDDLQSVVSKYQANPELLRLLLASKVEEDKRRTEEAKLKTKELDLYIQQQQQQQQQQQLPSPSNANSSHHSNSVMNPINSTTNSNFMMTAMPYPIPVSSNRNNNASPMATSSSFLSTSLFSSRRESVSDIKFKNRSQSISSIGHVLSGSGGGGGSSSSSSSNNSHSNNNNSTVITTTTTTTPTPTTATSTNDNNKSNSSFASEVQLNRPLDYSSACQPSHSTLPLPLPLPQPSSWSNSSASLLPPPPSLSIHTDTAGTGTGMGTGTDTNTNTVRRRRSIQAITKIIETTEFPYNDHYFWKNNGNTIQKKTGLKSTYYKCANSIKGCPVNKTVVEQPNGIYLIKYRGEHIDECSKFEHIRDF